MEILFIILIGLLSVGMFITLNIRLSHAEYETDKLHLLRRNDRKLLDKQLNNNRTPSPIPTYVTGVRRKKDELVEYLGVIYLVLKDNYGGTLPANNPTEYRPLDSETINFGYPVSHGEQPSTCKGKVSDVKLEIGRTWSKDEIKADAQKFQERELDERMEALEKYLKIELTPTKTTPAHYKKITKK